MAPLFGESNDMKQVGADMQKLSEQIGALQQKLAAKTAEADSLRTQAAQGAGASVALEDAEAQMQVLRDQLKEMQNKPAQSSAASADLDAAHAQIQALQNQLSALQQSAGSKAAFFSASSLAVNNRSSLSASVTESRPVPGVLSFAFKFSRVFRSCLLLAMRFSMAFVVSRDFDRIPPLERLSSACHHSNSS